MRKLCARSVISAPNHIASLKASVRAGENGKSDPFFFLFQLSFILMPTSYRMTFWQQIPRPIIGLSPMDGVTDASFRFITAKYGAPDVTFTEFVNVETAFYAPGTLIRDMTYSDLERPVIAQIYGHTPEAFYKVAQIVCELGFDGLDINMGCPAKKVAAKGSGAALIRNPSLARSIIRIVKRAIADWRAGQTLTDLQIRPELIEQVKIVNQIRFGPDWSPVRRSIPVSVKTRIGYDRIVIEDWIRILLDENLAAITLHGRTLQQQYRGCADWAAIARAAEIAKTSKTAILGNGDLRDMKDIYRRVHETGVDGVLLGRAAQGDPWIFRSKEQLKSALARNEPMESGQPPVPLAQRLDAVLEHAAHFEERWGPAGFPAMRKHLAWYCRCIPNAAALRAQVVRLNGFAELVCCLERYVSGLKLDSGPAGVDFCGTISHAAAAPYPPFRA
jgi:nifR3 family TIM-barrel protein